jgi:hypothetical protein
MYLQVLHEEAREYNVDIKYQFFYRFTIKKFSMLSAIKWSEKLFNLSLTRYAKKPKNDCEREVIQRTHFYKGN